VRREQFEHVIAAAAEVSGDREIVVIGSQAILGNVDEPPENMLFSLEADVYLRNDPGKAIEIEGSLGDGSPFQGMNGYYAHGVGPETAVAPRGWESRLVRYEVPPQAGSDIEAVAWCLEAHDLILAKCVAGRGRDWEFASDALSAGIAQIAQLLGRIEDLPEPPADRAHVTKMLEGIAARIDRDR